MNYYLTIAVGGALGAMSRYWASTLAEKYNSGQFPLGTFIVNVAGSLLIGFFFVLLTEKIQLAEHYRPLVMIGFLGAFTTFSTFSLDVVLLLQQGNVLTASWYIGLSVVTCVLATWATISIARVFI